MLCILQTVSYEEKNWYCKTMYIAGKNYDHIEGTNNNLTSPFMFSTNFHCFFEHLASGGMLASSCNFRENSLIL